jgi:hypothetical protein
MPIGRYLKRGVAFDPEAVQAMSRAFESVLRTLGIGEDEGQRASVAQLIVELASGNDKIDASALHDKAIAALTQHKSA